MKLVYLFRLFGILIFTFFVASCNSDCLSIQEKRVKELLNERLIIGDSRMKIEQEFHRIGIGLTFDKFQNRYQATIREGCGTYEAISVYLNLDAQEKLSKISVLKSYTNI